MLIEFRVANHRSIREEQVLSFEAANLGDADDPRPRVVPGHKKKLLPVAGIYGANASGKSNVLHGLAFMAHAVKLSHRMWEPEGGVPRMPFGWAGGKEEPSLFEVLLVLDGVRYQYGFTATDEAFVEEWLYAWPKGRKQTWFERDGMTVSFGDGFQGERQATANVMRPNSLFLSAAAQNQLAQALGLTEWFGKVTGHNLRFDSALAGDEQPRSVARALRDSDIRRYEARARIPGFRESLHGLLGEADLGVDAVRIVERHGEKRVEVHHPAGDVWFPLEEESLGTQTMFWLAPAIMAVVISGGLLMVDELDASLHPVLASSLLNLVQRPMFVTAGQLLFSTHDTSLLGTATGAPALRRDQVWLTEKDPATGATVLYPLTDYKPRSEENLERGYLQGRYGAVPFLGDLAPAFASDGT